MHDDNAEQSAVDAYFKEWSALINDLIEIDKSEKLEYGSMSAMQLGLCYIEALGKLYLFESGKDSLGPAAIFYKTLKLFHISRKDAKKVYSYRSEMVHIGPDLRNITVILLNTKENIDINIEWCVTTLNTLLEKVKNIPDRWTLENIAAVFKPKKTSICQYCQKVRNG